jgi:hypothetical protein
VEDEEEEDDDNYVPLTCCEKPITQFLLEAVQIYKKLNLTAKQYAQSGAVI